MNKEDLKEIVKEFLSPYINAMVDYKKLCDEKDKEIERLNNIINELEEYLIERIEYNQGSELQDYLENTYSTIYSVLQELKGDSSNDK